MDSDNKKPATSIESIRDIEIVFALKKLSHYLVDTGWLHQMDNDEFGAEFNLAVARSKRHSEDIIQLSKLDPELGWGATKKQTGEKTWVTYSGGDFNPWYKGALTIEDLVDSTDELSYLLSTISPGSAEDIEFIHYHDFLASKFKKTYKKLEKEEAKISIKTLHPKILKASKSLFLTGHFSSSILEAYKVIFNEIKDLSEIRNLDGKKLAERAFTGSTPIIQLNELQTESDIDEQNGFTLLLSGAALGVRNPKAHDLVVQTDENRTLEYLSFASLLLSRIDERNSINIPKSKDDVGAKPDAAVKKNPINSEEMPYVYMKPGGISSNGTGISILQAETFNLSDSFIFVEKAVILGREIKFNDMLVKAGDSVSHTGISDLEYPTNEKPYYLEIHFKSKNNAGFVAKQKLELQKRADGRYNLTGFSKATVTRL